MVPRRLWLGATLLSAVLAGEALAQGGGAPPPGLPPGFKMPSREEIRAQVQRLVDSTPPVDVELPADLAELVKITYKPVPTDPQAVARQLGQQMGGGALPPGADGMIKQFEPMIAEVLNESLANIGTFEAKVELKLKSKRITVGVWRMGLQFEGERPVAVILTPPEGTPGRPVELRLKTRAVDPQPALKIEVKPPTSQTAGAEKFDLQLTFMRFEAKSKTKVERSAGGAAPAHGADDDKKDDKDEGATPPAPGGKP